MFKKSVKLSLLCTAGVIFVTPSVALSEVQSMSLERFNNSADERYWEVSVTCAGDAVDKLIKRVVGTGNTWCSVSDAAVCDESKFALSRKLCGAASTVQATAAEMATPSEKPVVDAQASAPIQTAETVKTDSEIARTELLKEQVQIEEQRIKIEQQRLKLMETELKLKKQLEQY